MSIDHGASSDGLLKAPRDEDKPKSSVISRYWLDLSSEKAAIPWRKEGTSLCWMRRVVTLELWLLVFRASGFLSSHSDIVCAAPKLLLGTSYLEMIQFLDMEQTIACNSLHEYSKTVPPNRLCPRYATYGAKTPDDPWPGPTQVLSCSRAQSTHRNPEDMVALDLS
jgi:hypothetical protein